MFPPYTSISVALQSSTFTAVWHKWHLFPPQAENDKLFLCHSRNELHIVDSSCENEKPVCEWHLYFCAWRRYDCTKPEKHSPLATVYLSWVEQFQLKE